jgi:quercetin dioxygenase-like cupin family protein
MPKKREDSIAQVGKTIHKVRESKKASLDQIANETGFSIDYLKEIEAGKVFPSVGALLQIAKALEIDSGFFLRERQSTLSKRINAYTKRAENYAYTTLTPGAENKHLKAFKVTVEPLQDHKGVGYNHEGEEFVYVLQGNVEVIVGDHVNALGEGASLHFNSGIRHTLKNVGEKKAELLVVIYGP